MKKKYVKPHIEEIITEHLLNGGGANIPISGEYGGSGDAKRNNNWQEEDETEDLRYWGNKPSNPWDDWDD